MEVAIMKGQVSTQYGKVLIDTDVIAIYAGSVAVECFGIVGRVFNTCKWNNMAETAELRLFLCQVYKNLMLYGVVFHVKQWYNGGYETLV